MRGNLLGAVANDHDRALRAERLGGRENVADEGATEQRVQHLWERGLHPFALTGGENDDGARAGRGHERAPVGAA
ncbi:hypothetical protein Pa4123_35690 [Phytohabitans aurantiacus]|uniref:Uncharacterized protein n=1 Tax=Phytohabitans aurantiacus TaxID=3016789 RepID=A0ABQ5QX58_9ACTN|nr:hypothetical protein Pa4123_35690 [Phytohabitans aurantiacus]